MSAAGATAGGCCHHHTRWPASNPQRTPPDRMRNLSFLLPQLHCFTALHSMGLPFGQSRAPHVHAGVAGDWQTSAGPKDPS